MQVFLDALASLKTMFKINSVTHVFKISRLQSVREYCRVLQSITECYRGLQSVAEWYIVLQSITEYYRVLQSTTEYYSVLQSFREYEEYYRVFLAHILGRNVLKEKMMFVGGE